MSATLHRFTVAIPYSICLQPQADESPIAIPLARSSFGVGWSDYRPLRLRSSLMRALRPERPRR